MSSRFLLIYGLIPFALIGKPSEHQVVYGQATIHHSSDQQMSVSTSDKTIINWKSFSVDSHEIVSFNQPRSDSVVLNRVLSSETSKLFGSLQSNGKVILINPNGILFGENSTINTYDFIASTLDLLDSEFIKGDSLRFQGNSSASVVNLGTLKALGGNVTLIGRHITNEGSISAPEGEASLVSGSEVLIKPSGNNRIFIAPQNANERLPQTGVYNSGKIDALKARLMSDGNLYKLAIKHDGKVDAICSKEHEGEVYLVAEGGLLEVHGSISAPGGHVRLLGDQVALLDESLIDVSSPYKGGEVLIGGAFQGSDPKIYNAFQTYFGKDVQVKANALVEGDGGCIITWSDDQTVFYGTIEAKGGPQGGDGGFVEISGKIFLDMKGTVDRLAPKGNPGKLLLDPSDVTITTAATANMTFVPNTYSPTALLGCNLLNTDLTSQLLLGPVTVTTSSAFPGNGDMTIRADMDTTIATPYSTANTLTLVADRDLLIQGNVQNEKTGDIICSVGRDLIVDGANAVGLGSRLGSRYGNVTVTTVGNVIMNGGSGPSNRPAQIGYTATDMQSNIEMTIGRHLFMQSTDEYTLIGHTFVGANPPPMNFTGDITINSIGGQLIMQAGGDANSFCQIGLAPHQEDTISNPVTGRGNVTISNVASNIRLSGGFKNTGCYAMIGHGGRARRFSDSFEGDISVSNGADIMLIGGMDSPNNNFAAIGYGQSFPLNGGSHTFTSNLINVSADGDITLQAGQAGPGNHAYIGAYTGSGVTVGPAIANISIGTINVSSGGSSSLLGDSNANANSDAMIGLLGSNGPALTSINLTTGTFLDIIAGNPTTGTSNAAIRNAIRTQGGFIDVTVQNGNANLIGSPHPNAGEADITSFGTLDIAVLNGNLNVTTLDDGAFISTLGPGSIFASNDITVTGNPNLPLIAYIKGSSSLNVRAGDNINLVENALITNAGGTLEVIAGNDINMSSLAQIINGGGDLVNIVVDDDFPSPPGIGPGALNMATGSIIFGDGLVRVFTARQGQNNIQGLINATPFVPGPLYADQAPEKWLTYYFDSFFHTGSPFTIFYKDGVTSVANIQRSQVLISEFLTDLHPYNEFLGWFMEFQTAYDINAYKKTPSRGISSYQVAPDQLYYLRMKKNFDHNPRITHLILFPKKLESNPQLGSL